MMLGGIALKLILALFIFMFSSHTIFTQNAFAKSLSCYLQNSAKQTMSFAIDSDDRIPLKDDASDLFHQLNDLVDQLLASGDLSVHGSEGALRSFLEERFWTKIVFSNVNEKTSKLLRSLDNNEIEGPSFVVEHQGRKVAYYHLQSENINVIIAARNYNGSKAVAWTNYPDEKTKFEGKCLENDSSLAQGASEIADTFANKSVTNQPKSSASNSSVSSSRVDERTLNALGNLYGLFIISEKYCGGGIFHRNTTTNIKKAIDLFFKTTDGEPYRSNRDVVTDLAFKRGRELFAAQKKTLDIVVMTGGTQEICMKMMEKSVDAVGLIKSASPSSPAKPF